MSEQPQPGLGPVDPEDAPPDPPAVAELRVKLFGFERGNSSWEVHLPPGGELMKAQDEGDVATFDRLRDTLLRELDLALRAYAQALRCGYNRPLPNDRCLSTAEAKRGERP